MNSLKTSIEMRTRGEIAWNYILIKYIETQAKNYKSIVLGQKQEQKLSQGIHKLPILTNHI